MQVCYLGISRDFLTEPCFSNMLSKTPIAEPCSCGGLPVCSPDRPPISTQPLGQQVAQGGDQGSKSLCGTVEWGFWSLQTDYSSRNLRLITEHELIKKEFTVSSPPHRVAASPKRND